MLNLSIIMPTYAPHHKYLDMALMSVDYPADLCEIIVVNDSPETPLTPPENSNIHVINRMSDEPRWGAGGARNRGAALAQGEALVFLDSDDFFIPEALRYMWNAYRITEKQTGEKQVIYGDVIRTDMGNVSPRGKQYRGGDINQSPFYLKNSVMPPVILIPKQYFDHIGGYVEENELHTLEELVLEADLYANCIRAEKIDLVTYVYRWSNHGRRSLSEPEQVRQAVQDFMYNRYHEFFTGERLLPFTGVDDMACGSCGKRPSYVTPTTPTNTRLVQASQLPQPASDEVLYLTYTDTNPTINIKGPATGLQYRWTRASRNNQRLVVDKQPEWVDVMTEVHIDDAKAFASMRKRHGAVFTPKLEVVAVESPTVHETATFKPSEILTESVETVTHQVIQQKFSKPQLADLVAIEKKQDKPRVTLLRVLEKALEA